MATMLLGLGGLPSVIVEQKKSRRVLSVAVKAGEPVAHEAEQEPFGIWSSYGLR
jgi:hypothetical protein